MKKIPATFVAVFALLLNSALCAQLAGPEGRASSAATKNADLSPASLLRRAYALGSNLPMEDHNLLLQSLVEASARLNIEETVPWANELFAASIALPPGPRRDLWQSTAIRAVARRNPEHALGLVNQMDQSPSSSAQAVFTNRRNTAVRDTFQMLLQEQGNAAIPAMQSCAQRLGDAGQYPYSAVIPLMMRSSPNQAVAQFKEAFDYYVRSAPSPANEIDFAALLSYISRMLPKEEVLKAANEYANRLQHYAESDPQNDVELRISTDKGTAVLENPGDRLIWESLPQLRQIDPELADRLSRDRPALNQPALTGANPQSTPYSKARPPEDSESMARWDTLQSLKATAVQNPMQSAQLATTVSDTFTRTSALADAASKLATQDPGQARALLEQAIANLKNMNDRQEQITTISDSISKAAERLGDPALLEQILRTGFELGRQEIASRQSASPRYRQKSAESGYGLLPLAELGARVSPTFTLEQINGLRNDAAQAFLLVEMARNVVQARPPENRNPK